MASAWDVAMATVNQATQYPDVQMTIRKGKQTVRLLHAMCQSSKTVIKPLQRKSFFKTLNNFMPHGAAFLFCALLTAYTEFVQNQLAYIMQNVMFTQ